jgi:Domain of unknown function (DUF4136)
MKALDFFMGYGFCRRLRHFPVGVVSLALIAMASAAACTSAPPKSQSMLDPQADFGAYTTFGWRTDATADGSSAPTSVVETQIRAAIASEMQRKGYVEAPSGSAADLLLDYEAARAEKTKSSPFRVGIGVGSYGSSGGASVGTSTSGVKNVSEGSLVVHAIDPVRNAEVWRSRVSRELGKGNVEPEDIQSVVAEVFSDFPARTPAQ